jgi:hypothetical protein
LHCLSLLSAKLFQNAWKWTQTYCTVDDTVAIDCFNCGQHCRTLGGSSSYVFLVKNCGLGHYLLCQKLLGLAWQQDLTWQPDPKHFQKEPRMLGPPARQDLIVLGLVEPDPKHFKMGLGLVVQPYPMILLFVL